MMINPVPLNQILFYFLFWFYYIYLINFKLYSQYSLWVLQMTLHLSANLILLNSITPSVSFGELILIIFGIEYSINDLDTFFIILHISSIEILPFLIELSNIYSTFSYDNTFVNASLIFSFCYIFP